MWRGAKPQLTSISPSRAMALPWHEPTPTLAGPPLSRLTPDGRPGASSSPARRRSPSTWRRSVARLSRRICACVTSPSTRLPCPSRQNSPRSVCFRPRWLTRPAAWPICTPGCCGLAGQLACLTTRCACCGRCVSARPWGYSLIRIWLCCCVRRCRALTESPPNGSATNCSSCLRHPRQHRGCAIWTSVAR